MFSSLLALVASQAQQIRKWKKRGEKSIEILKHIESYHPEYLIASSFLFNESSQIHLDKVFTGELSQSPSIEVNCLE